MEGTEATPLVLVVEREATPLGRSVSDDLVPKVERGYPVGGNEL